MLRLSPTACAFAASLGLGVLVSSGRAEPPPPGVAKFQARGASPAAQSDCSQRLKAVALFTPLPPMAGPGECGVEDPVKLQSVFMPDGSRVALEPPATLRCTMAEAVTQFVRGEVGPGAASLGAPLAALVTADAYDCRNRNRMQAAKISEHARGNALDIGALKLANRKSIDLTSHVTSEPFRARMREAACRFFTTVLGPGSDSYHNEHIHLDRAERRGGYRMCQWDLNHGALMAVAAAGGPVQQSVPLPPPKPPALRQVQREKENGAGPQIRRRIFRN